MTKLDELTQKASEAYAERSGGYAYVSDDCMRSAVLSVLAEVREMVPEDFDHWMAQYQALPVDERYHFNQDGAGFPKLTGNALARRAYNDCCAEMLRRLDQTMEGK